MMRRLLPLTLVLALALAACGTTEDPETAAAESGGGPVTVTDARGKKITLDAPAARVGGTEWNVVEYAASLGVDPVAVSDVKGFKAWDSAVTLPDDVTDLGTRGEPSTDTVASANLDVLFVTDELVGDAMEQIEKDTPIVVVEGGDSQDPVGAMWKNLDLVAKVTGTEDRAAELKQQYAAKVDETKKAVAGADLSPVAFSDAYAVSGKITIRPYGEGSLVGGVLADVGLENAWARVPGLEYDPAYGLGETDPEGLSKLPADTRFWYIGNDTDGGDVYKTELGDNRVWTSLPFVRDGQTRRVPDAIWMFGGPESMMQLLDAVQAIAKG